jgi:hypothetical protein
LTHGETKQLFNKFNGVFPINTLVDYEVPVSKFDQNTQKTEYYAPHRKIKMALRKNPL